MLNLFDLYLYVIFYLLVNKFFKTYGSDLYLLFYCTNACQHLGCQLFYHFWIFIIRPFLNFFSFCALYHHLSRYLPIVLNGNRLSLLILINLLIDFLAHNGLVYYDLLVLYYLYHLVLFTYPFVSSFFISILPAV